MQPNNHLQHILNTLPDTHQCAIFTLSDLRAILPEISANAFKALLSRAAKNNTLKRICRGIYINPNRCKTTGYELFHIAARLRAHEFNYISLESVLSDAGVISQIPMQTITVMSSGRTQTIECKELGRIEFIHTKKRPDRLTNQLSYDKNCHLWRANVSLAIEDMKATRRNLDLIDWDIVDEFI